MSAEPLRARHHLIDSVPGIVPNFHQTCSKLHKASVELQPALSPAASLPLAGLRQTRPQSPTPASSLLIVFTEVRPALQRREVAGWGNGASRIADTNLRIRPAGRLRVHYLLRQEHRSECGSPHDRIGLPGGSPQDERYGDQAQGRDRAALAPRAGTRARASMCFGCCRAGGWGTAFAIRRRAAARRRACAGRGRRRSRLPWECRPAAARGGSRCAHRSCRRWRPARAARASRLR